MDIYVTNCVMLATADDDVGLASFQTFAVAGQDAADRLGCSVTARDAVSDEGWRRSNRADRRVM